MQSLPCIFLALGQTTERLTKFGNIYAGNKIFINLNLVFNSTSTKIELESGNFSNTFDKFWRKYRSMKKSKKMLVFFFFLVIFKRNLIDDNLIQTYLYLKWMANNSCNC